jgi:hypothetical protein
LYCPLCKLQTTRVIERASIPRPRATSKSLFWIGIAGVPILALTLLLHAAFAVTVFANRSAKAPADALRAIPSVTESRSRAIPLPRQPQPETVENESTCPPQELVVSELPPPEARVELAPPPALKQAPTAEAPTPAEPVVKKNDPPKTCEKPSGMFGTSLIFAADPTEAKKQAAAKEKLVFLLHVSGDFDDAGFT